VFRLACTVQPKARPAGDTVTVAGSGLIRTPSLRGTRRMGTQTRRAPQVTGSGVSRTSTWPWAPAIVQAAQQVCGGLPASLTSISCLTRSRPHEGRVPSTARRSNRPATSAHRHCAGERRSPHLQRHIMPGSARHRAAASATRLPTISAAELDARLSGAQQAVGRRGVSHAPCRRWLACEASSGDRLHPRLTHRACWLDRLGELHDRPGADGAGFIVGAAPGRCRARSDAVTGKSFRRGAGLSG
jgi:hypothetical protein